MGYSLLAYGEGIRASARRDAGGEDDGSDYLDGRKT